eukprot:2113814-Rhodomonas_salina.2
MVQVHEKLGKAPTRSLELGNEYQDGRVVASQSISTPTVSCTVIQCSGGAIAYALQRHCIGDPRSMKKKTTPVPEKHSTYARTGHRIPNTLHRCQYRTCRSRNVARYCRMIPVTMEHDMHARLVGAYNRSVPDIA